MRHWPSWKPRSRILQTPGTAACRRWRSPSPRERISDLGGYPRATELLGKVLAFATESRNEELMAQARSSLATLASSQGRLLEALEHRTVSVRLRRALGDTETLPYDLTNQAEVLIRLGRGAEAKPLLSELEAGIASGAGAFPSRVRRLNLLRALLAMTNGEYRRRPRPSRCSRWRHPTSR